MKNKGHIPHLPDELNEAQSSRRAFLKTSMTIGGGLAMSVHLPGLLAATHTDLTFRPSVWLEIQTDNSVLITIAKSDMGQGVRTSLAMLVAEELDADWDLVQVKTAENNDKKYGRQGTGGSASIRSNWIPLRTAGASARQLLLEAASEHWSVPASELSTADSHVYHEKSSRRVSYGDLAASASRLEIPENPVLKSPDQFTLLGKEKQSIDLPDILAGKAAYGMDTLKDNLLVAVVAHCPVFGGDVESWDDRETLKIPGVIKTLKVKAVADKINSRAGVAVIARHTWAAIKGRDVLKVKWQAGKASGESSSLHQVTMAKALADKGQVEVNRLGNPDTTLDSADKTYSRTYQLPFLSHSPMEPMNATCELKNGECHIRIPIQHPNWAARSIAKVLDIPQEKVHVEIPLLGGAFGRRINPDIPVEAALIARQLEQAVKLVWTREDDLQHDLYRPCAMHRIDACLGEDGYPLAWRHRMTTPAISSYLNGAFAEKHAAGESDGGGNTFYRVPNRSLEYTYLDSAVPRGWWRAVHTTHTLFAVETMMDELAEAAGMDAVDYRLALIDKIPVDNPPQSKSFPFDPERMKGVLKLAAEKSAWGKPLPEGHAHGLACAIDHLSYAVVVLEVRMNGNIPVVEKAIVAADCGPVINPLGARAQLEGGVIMGLSSALHEEISIADGRVEQSNFHDYRLLRFSEAPKEIHCYFQQTDTHPTGVGEPSLPPVAPALANAMYRLTGKRQTRLPLSKHAD